VRSFSVSLVEIGGIPGSWGKEADDYEKSVVGGIADGGDFERRGKCFCVSPVLQRTGMLQWICPRLSAYCLHAAGVRISALLCSCIR